VTLSDGSVPVDARVNLCSTLQCKPTSLDASGNFSYTGLGGNNYAIDVEPHGDGEATILTFISIAQEEIRTFEQPILVPHYETELSVDSAGPVAIGDSLTIEVDPDGYTPPFGFESEGTEVSGVHIDVAESGLPVDNIQGEIVGMWYLGFWNTSLDPAWAISVTGLEGVSEGDVLQIKTGDYLGVQWIDGGTLTVGSDGSATSDPGSGINFLSTLLVIKP